MKKAHSRIKKQRRDIYGKYTSRMSWKERLFIISLLLLTMLYGYYNYSRSHVRDNSDVINKPGEQQHETTPTEVQGSSISVLQVEQAEAKEITEKEKIIHYIVEVFGEDAVEALMIARCESMLDPSRIGDENLMLYDSVHDEWVGDSIGVFQIRTGGRGWNRARANNMTADEFRVYLKDFKNNINYAKTIFNRGQWSAWTCRKEL